jgi:DNA-binding MarR family transcriptional regulator
MPNIVQGARLGLFQDRAVTQTQFLLLVSLHARGRCAMSALAEHMSVQLPTMTGMVNRLVKAGYVTRVENEQDRRQVMIELTAKGRAFIKNFQSIISKRWEDVLLALSPGEVEAFHSVIVKLNKSLGGSHEAS